MFLLKMSDHFSISKQQLVVMCEPAAMQLKHIEKNVDAPSKKKGKKKNHPVSIATGIINDLVIVSAPEGGVKSATAVIRWLKSGRNHKLLSVLLNSFSELKKNDESKKQLLNCTITEELFTFWLHE